MQRQSPPESNMEVAITSFLSDGSFVCTLLPGEWIMGNHYTGTITIDCIPLIPGTTPLTSLSYWGSVNISGFQNEIVIPVACSTATGVGSKYVIDFDCYVTSVPSACFVFTNNAEDGSTVINVVVNKNV